MLLPLIIEHLHEIVFLIMSTGMTLKIPYVRYYIGDLSGRDRSSIRGDLTQLASFLEKREEYESKYHNNNRRYLGNE